MAATVLAASHGPAELSGVASAPVPQKWRTVLAAGIEPTTIRFRLGLPNLRFSPSGEVLVLAGGHRERRLTFWHATKGHLIASYDIPERLRHLLAFSDDGSLLASTTDAGVVIVWRVPPS